MKYVVVLLLASILCVYGDTYTWSTTTAPFTNPVNTQAQGVVANNNAIFANADNRGNTYLDLYSASGVWSTHQMAGPYYNHFGVASPNSNIAVVAGATILETTNGNYKVRVTLESYNSATNTW